MDLDYEEEVVETTSKMYAITMLSVLIIFIFLVCVVIWAIKESVSDILKNNYHVLEVNEENKDIVISILKEEELKYCDSIYKIEYSRLFKGGKEFTIYCEDEDDIIFKRPYKERSNIESYINENGLMERR